MANTMTIDQISTVLKAVLKDATGQDTSALDISQLLTLGTTTLTTGSDPVLSAISQVLTKTIFSNRPYNAKFKGIRVDGDRWGNWVRKLKIIDTPNDLQDNPYTGLTDGQAVDQYTVNKPKALQLNFVGQQVYQVTKTIFSTQLDVAFNSAEEFERFISMVLTYVNNKVEKIHEETARAAIAGVVAQVATGITDGSMYVATSASKGSGSDVHLVTEYKAEKGISDDTAVDTLDPDFVRWVYARIQRASDMMTEYTVKYQGNLTTGNFVQHTPKDKQLLYINSGFMRNAETSTMATTFHADMLKMIGDAELVNYWQEPTSPMTIRYSKYSYLKNDGTIVTPTSAKTVSNVLAVLMDKEACAYSPILTRNTVTPFNAAGEYYNLFWKFNERTCVDATEKAIVFFLD